VYNQLQWQLGVLQSWTAREIFELIGLDFDGALAAAGLVPAQHAACKFEWMDLVVSCIDDSGVVKDTHVQRVYFDPDWWDEHLQKVSRIYLNAYLPEKAHPRRNNKAGSCRNYVLNKGRCVGYDGEVEKWGPEWGLDSDGHLEPFAE
jgi:hypothetical protein